MLEVQGNFSRGFSTPSVGTSKRALILEIIWCIAVLIAVGVLVILLVPVLLLFSLPVLVDVGAVIRGHA